MRVLIGCEVSGVVRRAFRAAGHDAWSCDLQPAADGSPFHLQSDLFSLSGDFDIAKRGNWDLGILHPVCTRLANSGVLRLYVGGKKRNGFDGVKLAELAKGRDFWLACWNAPIARLCVENPIAHCHAKLPPWTQTIQPWQFGDPESKRTCLWLRNLPPLVPTNILPLPECGHWQNQTKSGQNKLSPGPKRAALRAVTYPGIAAAMAAQWGGLIS